MSFSLLTVFFYYLYIFYFVQEIQELYGVRRLELLRPAVAAHVLAAVAACASALPADAAALGALTRELSLYLAQICRAERQVCPLPLCGSHPTHAWPVCSCLRTFSRWPRSRSTSFSPSSAPSFTMCVVFFVSVFWVFWWCFPPLMLRARRLRGRWCWRGLARWTRSSRWWSR